MDFGFFPAVAANTTIAAFVAVVTTWMETILPALAAEDDDVMIMAKLPPLYVPILFGLILLGGVGFLTTILGYVMDEELFLGL